jgi:hypothetical protein
MGMVVMAMAMVPMNDSAQKKKLVTYQLVNKSM